MIFFRVSAAFSLGLERTGGFETVAFCEIEKFPRKVLTKNWPKVPCYHDIRELTKHVLDRDGIAVDVITGGFPCQDISVAGKQAGISEGTRSGLWGECLRLLSELQSDFAIFENVTNLLAGPSNKPGAWFGRILADLASIRYDAEWHYLPACYVGASHLRGRVWIIAYPYEIRQGWFGKKPIFKQQSLQRKPSRGFKKLPNRSDMLKAGLCVRYDGFPKGLDQIAALGNAVVPQIPELIGTAILQSIGWHESEATCHTDRTSQLEEITNV